MGSAFHQLCPRYSGTLTPTAPTAIRLWDTFTFFYSPETTGQRLCKDYDIAGLLIDLRGEVKRRFDCHKLRFTATR